MRCLRGDKSHCVNINSENWTVMRREISIDLPLYKEPPSAYSMTRQTWALKTWSEVQIQPEMVTNMAHRAAINMKVSLNTPLTRRKWHRNSNVLMKLQDDVESKVMCPIQVVLSNFYSTHFSFRERFMCSCVDFIKIWLKIILCTCNISKIKTKQNKGLRFALLGKYTFVYDFGT